MKKSMILIIPFSLLLFFNIASGQNDNFMLDQSPIIMPESNYQGVPSVAFNGTDCFTVWADNRTAVSSVLMGTFIDQEGNILNPAGKLLLESPGNKNEPTVVFDGTNFFVTWRDDRNGEDDIFGARFTSEGELIGDEIVISTIGGDEWGQEVTFDGTNYFVAWSDYRNGSADIYGARIDQSGNVLDPNGIAICNAASDQEYPRVSAGASSYLVVWEDYRIDPAADYYGGRVEFNGTVLDPDGFIIKDGPDDQYWGDVDYDGVNWFVIWGGTYEILGTRISSSGNILDPGGIVVSPPNIDGYYNRLEFDGTNYLITWYDYTADIRAARITTSGTLLDPDGIDISVQFYDESFPAIGYGNGKFFIAWMDERNGGYGADIYGARVSTNGTLLDTDGLLLSASANKQTYPGCAFDGVNYLVAWQDNRNTDTLKIYAALINQVGNIISPGVFQLSNTPGNQRYPSVSYDGSNYLVVWADEREGSDIYGTRVSTQGAILDPSGIQICTYSGTQSSPSISSNGSQSLVVWRDYRSSQKEIRGARIDQSGAVLEPDGFQIYSGANCGNGGIGVTFGSDSYLVVWAKDSGGNNPYDVYGGRVSPDGTIMDPGGFVISSAPNNQDGPDVAFDGTNFFVVWMDNRNAVLEDDIYGARVSTDGTILDASGIPITTEPDYQQVPDVVFDGDQYIIAWFDKGDDMNLKATEIDLSGNITDTYTISDQFGMQTYPSLVHGPEDQVLVTYQGFATEYNNISYNADRIWGTYLGLYIGVDDFYSNTSEAFTLCQNYPNPFENLTVINYELKLISDVNLKILDINGNEVTTLLNLKQSPGNYKVEFDAQDLPNGIYFCCLTTNNRTKTLKMVKIK
jgi:hypothetical protein